MRIYEFYKSVVTKLSLGHSTRVIQAEHHPVHLIKPTINYQNNILLLKLLLIMKLMKPQLLKFHNTQLKCYKTLVIDWLASPNV